MPARQRPGPPVGWLPRAEHVCITESHRVDLHRSPGILLAWRSDGTAWEGWVIYAQDGTPAHGDGRYVRRSWVGANVIQRA